MADMTSDTACKIACEAQTGHPQPSEAFQNLQNAYAKQQQSLVTLHEMHSKRVSDLQLQIQLLKQKEEEAVQRVEDADQATKAAEAKLDLVTLELNILVENSQQKVVAQEKEYETKLTSLHSSLAEVIQKQKCEMESATNKLEKTRIELVKAKAETVKVPKLIAEAVNEVNLLASVHILNLEKQIRILSEEKSANDNEREVLQKNLLDLSNRVSQNDKQWQTQVEKQQNEILSSRMQYEELQVVNRALECRIEDIKNGVCEEHCASIEQLNEQLVRERELRCTTENLYEQLKEKVCVSEKHFEEYQMKATLDIKRNRDCAWKNALLVAQETKSYNELFAALHAKLNSANAEAAATLSLRDSTIELLRQELISLRGNMENGMTEQQISQQEELDLLRDQITQLRQVKTPQDLPASVNNDAIRIESIEQENASLKMQLQTLQITLEMQRSEQEMINSELRQAHASEVEIVHRNSTEKAEQSFEMLQKYRNESLQASENASRLEARVRELEQELKSTVLTLNRARAKAILQENSEKADEEPLHSRKR